jgi:hypothetical protein
VVAQFRHRPAGMVGNRRRRLAAIARAIPGSGHGVRSGRGASSASQVRTHVREIPVAAAMCACGGARRRSPCRDRAAGGQGVAGSSPVSPTEKPQVRGGSSNMGDPPLLCVGNSTGRRRSCRSSPRGGRRRHRDHGRRGEQGDRPVGARRAGPPRLEPVRPPVIAAPADRARQRRAVRGGRVAATPHPRTGERPVADDRHPIDPAGPLSHRRSTALMDLEPVVAGDSSLGEEHVRLIAHRHPRGWWRVRRLWRAVRRDAGRSAACRSARRRTSPSGPVPRRSPAARCRRPVPARSGSHGRGRTCPRRSA